MLEPSVIIDKRVLELRLANYINDAVIEFENKHSNLQIESMDVSLMNISAIAEKSRTIVGNVGVNVIEHRDQSVLSYYGFPVK